MNEIGPAPFVSWALSNKAEVFLGRDVAEFAAAIGKDSKGKLSPVFYLIAIPLAFMSPWIASSPYLSNPITTFAGGCCVRHLQ